MDPISSKEWASWLHETAALTRQTGLLVAADHPYIGVKRQKSSVPREGGNAKIFGDDTLIAIFPSKEAMKAHGFEKLPLQEIQDITERLFNKDARRGDSSAIEYAKSADKALRQLNKTRVRLRHSLPVRVLRLALGVSKTIATYFPWFGRTLRGRLEKAEARLSRWIQEATDLEQRTRAHEKILTNKLATKQAFRRYDQYIKTSWAATLNESQTDDVVIKQDLQAFCTDLPRNAHLLQFFDSRGKQIRVDETLAGFYKNNPEIQEKLANEGFEAVKIILFLTAQLEPERLQETAEALITWGENIPSADRANHLVRHEILPSAMKKLGDNHKGLRMARMIHQNLTHAALDFIHAIPDSKGKLLGAHSVADKPLMIIPGEVGYQFRFLKDQVLFMQHQNIVFTSDPMAYRETPEEVIPELRLTWYMTMTLPMDLSKHAQGSLKLCDVHIRPDLAEGLGKYFQNLEIETGPGPSYPSRQ